MERDDARLWDAYRATVYEVITPEGVVPIRIGHEHPLVDRLCVLASAESWCFVTAWNPGSRALLEPKNRDKNEELRAELGRQGLVLFEGVGRGDDPAWEPEESFLVLGADRATAIALGRRWGQNAVVFGERGSVAELVACSSYDESLSGVRSSGDSEKPEV